MAPLHPLPPGTALGLWDCTQRPRVQTPWGLIFSQSHRDSKALESLRYAGSLAESQEPMGFGTAAPTGRDSLGILGLSKDPKSQHHGGLFIIILI